jgi:transposase
MRKLTLTLTEEECITLEQLGKNHPKPYFRLRGQALVAVSQGNSLANTAAILSVSGESIRTWIHDWGREGLVGILRSRTGGRPPKLTEDLIDLAVAAATKEPMSLAQIAAYLRQKCPDAREFSLDRLGVRLKERGLSFKRVRYSLKKKGS